MKDKKVAIVGCGNLGLSILNGLIDKKTVSPSNLTVTRRNLSSLEYLEKTGVQLSTDNSKAIADSEVIIVALKPYNILEVLKEVYDVFVPGKHILISLATGISLEDIQNVVKSPIPIFRAMPNTAADVGMSMTCISTTTNDKEAIKLVEKCFNSIGESIIINENLMDSATVLGACGIAYVLRFIRAMVQGGIQIGFDAKTANNIVTQTVKGASELLVQRKNHPEYEIDKVTTPKGCTIEGLNEMEHNGFSSALIKGIVASFNKIEK
ncbi:pyrroline-5-carboxylate reductase [Weeksellaceae bacterium TAE3-ERU29]|nr:pyrroline-5-carboxylate reductase [Weeksellaceae bacterium TAE3-ERU29]